ncbi:MAG: amylo-alpha-1,6-glucosidase [Verrucomicrobiota bacterium]
MTPAPGERLLRFSGDRVRFSLRSPNGGPLPAGWRALLRTNIGRADVLRREIIEAHFQQRPFAGASWRDIPMAAHGNEWTLDLPLIEPGYFKAKAYAVNPQGRQFWPEGPDTGISVHPSRYRTANTIYCAFPRMFGASKTARATIDPKRDADWKRLDEQGYTLIPPSGKIRDLIQELPHIIDTLGCRIVHLLPVNPTPTTYARFGRYGSPYACEDLTMIDPALVEFDKQTTGIEQFQELTYAAHSRGARVFLDMVINHTGWGSTLQENHPEWFQRKDDGTFVSPGAWGVTWEDLVELDQRFPELWETLAEAFLTWCRRGVDGFRCDAGYKVPLPAWQYITARVHEEFPETVFLLEGLGGGWNETETLLTEGGMQWAYSELFQELSGLQVSGYLDHALKQSARVGVLVHYSETHDNDRLAAKGRTWSLLRNQLSALTSVSGGFGFTCGVEWLAAEKFNVHSSRGLSWGSATNLIPELSRLNQLLAAHPCFFDNARLTRISPAGAPVYALLRESADGRDNALVLANTDAAQANTFPLPLDWPSFLGKTPLDLLDQPLPKIQFLPGGKAVVSLPAGACYCLAKTAKAHGLAGDDYRAARARAEWALHIVGHVLAAEDIGPYDWPKLAELADTEPQRFLAAALTLTPENARRDLVKALQDALAAEHYPPVVVWNLADRKRITPVPPKHWLLVSDTAPFRATLRVQGRRTTRNAESLALRHGHVASFPPAEAGEAALALERYAKTDSKVEAALRYLSAEPHGEARPLPSTPSALVLLTNGIGGMARLGVDLGRIQSKYDCLLGANLHSTLPVDRHVFAKRARVWINADGYISALDWNNLARFEEGPPAKWHFTAHAGDGRTVDVCLLAAMLPGRNTTALHFERPMELGLSGKTLPPHCDVRLVVRVDIEDRNFHWETKRNPGADLHFATHARSLSGRAGFEFKPAADRQIRVFANSGSYHHEAEWCHDIPHPVEQSRGMTGSGDAYSPGWFELPLPKGQGITLVVCADATDPSSAELEAAGILSSQYGTAFFARRDFERKLVQAVKAFVVRRGEGKTVIAGYPWFLDWGRDSLIAARGMLAAGMTREVEDLLAVFGRFEENGTLPNTIHGDNASNRDTSDAPLWYGIVCEELAGRAGPDLYAQPVDARGRRVADVLHSIASGYLKGTPNGIHVDLVSGLVWSPSHFTWMDTNFPAATPRQGYPVEIQCLWIRLLRQLARLADAGVVGDKLPVELPPTRDGKTAPPTWAGLAARAEQSFGIYYWLEDQGWLADNLVAQSGTPARTSPPDNALRSNCLFAVTLGLLSGERARRCVEAARRHLVVPGALRSLAPLPVMPPLPVVAADGRLLNNPNEPYLGRYEGDEDTRRKPAYHNGTAWTWTFPVFCEALARAWDNAPPAVAAARAYLGSMERLLDEGCLGQLSEIVDGDAPHQQRGCDAQAWGATEALRVWKLLKS